MTLVATDGFDMYNGNGVGTGLGARWTVTSTVTLPAGRFGGQGMSCIGGNTAVYATRTLPSAYGNLSIGMAVKWNSSSGTGAIWNLLLQLAGTVQCGWRINSVGAFEAYRGSTLLGTSATGSVASGSWNYVETEVVISSTVGRITIKVNSVTVLNLTAQNTQAAGSATADQLILGALSGFGSSSDLVFDDLYVLDVATSLGERRIETLRTTADSAVTWTPSSGANNYSRVNETLVDGDTSYVQTTGVGNADLYTIGSLSSTPATIDAVNVVSFAEKTDATTRTLYNGVKSGATVSNGAAAALNATYGRYDRIISLDPATAAAWTASGVNNLLIGPNLAS